MEHHVKHNKDLDLHSTDTDGAEEESEWAKPLSQDKIKIGIPIRTDFAIACNTSVPKMEHKRTIIHFDMDCFYAQVEMLRNPELRNKPLGIQQKNIVVTTNYVARKSGVPKSTYVTEAKKICPDLVLVCGEDLTNYRQMSYRVSEFLQKYTPSVERLGFDENFLDVSELVTMRLKDEKYKQEFVGHVYESNKQEMNKPLCGCGCELRLQIGSQIAADIRDALEKELGITCCAGISFNKLLAKLVAGTHKPSQQTTILPHLTRELMSSLTSVLCIPGIGFRTSCRLKSHGISSVQNLQTSDRKLLEREFGPQLTQLMVQLSYGVDESPVITFSQPQTLSDEDSFKCCNEVVDAEHRIRDLLTSLLPRVVEDGRFPQTVRLTVRRAMNKYHRESRQCPVPTNTFTKCLQDCASGAVVERLMPVFMNLFSKLVDTSKPFHLTLIGICFARMVKPAGEIGGIGTFFSKADAISQHVSPNMDLNEVIEDPNEGVCRSITKSSPLKSGAKPKLTGKTKTIQHFFLKTNNDACTKQQNLDNVSEPHTPIDVSLFEDGVKERLVNNSPTNKASSSVGRVEHSTDSSYQVLKAAVTDNPHCGQTGNCPGISNEVSRGHTSLDVNTSEQLCLDVNTSEQLCLDVNTSEESSLDVNTSEELCLDVNTSEELCLDVNTSEELCLDVNTSEESSLDVNTSEESCLNVNTSEESSLDVNTSEESSLQNLLPAEVDAQIIAELPKDIQNEILLQYGIYAEELPQGRRFTKISHKIKTRSHKTQELTTVGPKQDQPCPRTKKGTKRISECYLLNGEAAGSIARKRKTLFPEGGPGISFKTGLHLNVTEAEECSAEIVSQNLSKRCTRNDTPLGGNNMEVEHCSPDYVLASIDNFVGEDNVDNNFALENLRSNLNDSVFSCVSHDQHRQKIFIKSNVDTDNIDTDLEQNGRGISAANYPGPPSDKSVMSPPPSDKSLMSPPPSDKSVMSPPPSDKSVMSPPPSDKSVMSPPPSDKSVMSPSPSDKSVMSPPPSDKSVMSPPPSDKSVMSPPPSDKSLMSPPPSDKSLMSPPPSDKSVMSPPPSDKSVMSPPPSDKSVMSPPPSDKSVMSPQPSYKSLMSPPPPSQTSRESCSTAPTLSSRRKVCHQKLPSNIDSEVFLSLPSNIRGEIMAHIVMGTSDNTSGQSITNAVPENQRNVKHIKSTKHKNQKSLLTYFNRRL